MAKAVNSKICLKCGRVLPLSSYYLNKSWKEQLYHDGYCRQCYANYCINEDTVEEYFMANNRKWNHELWQIASKKAQTTLSSNSTYLNATAQQKLKMLDASTIRFIPSLMNLTRYYVFDGSQHLADMYDLERQKNAQERRNAKLTYSPVWRGSFTEEQIKTLDAMYEEYEKDFDLSTASRRDYVRKVIKASLNADIAEDRLRKGQISVTEYRDIQKVFDDLSKSSALAEGSRKAGTSTALNSLGNIILGLQINHHLDINPYTFPEDDVDKVYNDYAHLATAIGAQI